ncbi:putative cyclin-B3-1 isoform X2 [Ziziphus jujuba]|uniref:B-like cyclin n=1 Tax=Ziziphus jujuba TaxID=326968 RepID=A0ABM3IC73_ZIZJJ|nr:putative cyclin-B3-1 isoform X2 [Ziziphus jujuba]
MASLKILDQQQLTKKNPERNKMVPNKAKVGIGLNGPSRDNLTRVGARNFKVFIENRTAKVDSLIRQSVADNKGSTQASTIGSKGGLRSLEKSKGKNECGAKPKVQRSALADISNIHRNSSSNLKLNGSKPMVSVAMGTRTASVSSRKSILGSRQGNLDQGVSDSLTSKRSKDLKVPSYDQRIKATGLLCETIIKKGRRTVRDTLIPTRKSLPVLKRVDQANKSIPKENAASSQQAKEENGCPVKAKTGRKIMLRVSNAKMQLWRNRVSDGFIITDQTSMGSHTTSRQPIRPIVKTTLKASNAKRNMKSQNTSGPDKLINVASTSSKKRVVAKSSVSENIVHEATCTELPSDRNCKPSTSDTTGMGKSNRRRSYTSLLMGRSKLLEEHGEVMEQEKLPSIDDDGNQLEVADYVDEIYQYYWVTEAQNPPLANYMSIQKDLTPHMRAILINWLIEVHFKFDLMQETLYLMVTLLDRYLSQVIVEKNELQLVGLTALLLASKYEDFWHPRVKDLISISAESYTRDQMLGMESLILKKLKFRLNAPTPYVFMLRFLKAAQSDTKLEHLAFYLIELSLVEYEALMFKPSLLCASAIYVARCTLQMTPWTPLLCRHARCEVSQIRDCAEMILGLQKAARGGQLKVTYEKYMSPELSGVAAIRPLDSLPF